MAVAIQATRSKILTTLSPVGLFWLIINLILINNFIITVANIHNYFKNASFLFFNWNLSVIILGLYWSSRIIN